MDIKIKGTVICASDWRQSIKKHKKIEKSLNSKRIFRFFVEYIIYD